MPLTPSPAPASEHRAERATATARGRSRRCPTPHAGGRERDRAPVVVHAGRPAGGEHRRDPADGRRRPQQADHRRPAVALRERREERERHAEEHRVHVDHVGAEQLLRVPAYLTPSSTPRRLGGSASGGGGGVRMNAKAVSESTKEPMSIAYAVGDARRAMITPASAGPAIWETLAKRPVDRGRGLELVALDQPREQGVQRRPEHGAGARRTARRDVEHPQLRGRNERVDEQRDRDEGGPNCAPKISRGGRRRRPARRPPAPTR